MNVIRENQPVLTASLSNSAGERDNHLPATSHLGAPVDVRENVNGHEDKGKVVRNSNPSNSRESLTCSPRIEVGGFGNPNFLRLISMESGKVEHSGASQNRASDQHGKLRVSQIRPPASAGEEIIGSVSRDALVNGAVYGDHSDVIGRSHSFPSSLNELESVDGENCMFRGVEDGWEVVEIDENGLAVSPEPSALAGIRGARAESLGSKLSRRLKKKLSINVSNLVDSVTTPIISPASGRRAEPPALVKHAEEAVPKDQDDEEEAHFFVYRVVMVKKEGSGQLMYKYKTKRKYEVVLKVSMSGLLVLDRKTLAKLHEYSFRQLNVITLKDTGKESKMRIIAFELSLEEGPGVAAFASFQCAEVVERVKNLMRKGRYAGLV
eukprot:comp17511_c0_seq1/m.17033 comp17511_c0_seq1/g.17033  ORF comp17511_c0_seq1/g.17033 comp17511_c0_seq1/m.17033 type:complete len:380 (-) comp17511_c0_seq1:90-1229(-)